MSYYTESDTLSVRGKIVLQVAFISNWERYGEMVDAVHSHNHLQPRVINPDGGVRKVLLEQVNTC